MRLIMAVGTQKQRRAFKRFSENTSIHGIGNIHNPRTRYHRFIWTALMFLGISILFHQIYGLTEKLLGHQASTELLVDYKSSIDFPTVSICNLNPVRMNKRSLLLRQNRRRRMARQISDEEEESNEEMLLLSEGQEEKMRKFEARKKSEERTFNRTDDEREAAELLGEMLKNAAEGYSYLMNSSFDAEFIHQQQLMFAMNTISAELREAITYSMKDILVDCLFLNRKCSADDFVMRKNPRYGNCFYFNAGMNSTKIHQPVQQLNKPGAEQSLTMTLFVDQDNYVPLYSPEAGFKVVIHNADEPSIPEEEGHLVKPGQFTSLSATVKVFERAEEPYGRCKYFTHEENINMNMFLNQMPLTSPTVPVCLRTCEQLHIIRTCGCYSMQLGFIDAEAFAKEHGNGKYIPACVIKQAGGDGHCINNVKHNLATGKLDCKDKCRYQKCNHTVYETFVSTALWPALNGIGGLKQRIKNVLRLKNMDRGKMETSKQFIRRNFAKIQVYLQDMTVITARTRPSYTFLEFLSDVGSNGSLWLGMSVFSVFEIVVFISRLLCGFYVPEEEPIQNVRRDKEKGNDVIELSAAQTS